MGVKGKDRAIRRLRALGGGGLEKAIGPALFAAGELIADAAQDSIMRGSVSGKNHVPSRPGEPPNNDTRVLHDGIEVTMPSKLTVRITSTAPYSAALEFGTSRMEARPFMRPARDKMRKQAKALVDEAFSRFVKSTKQGAD